MPEVVYDVDGQPLEKSKAQKLSKQNKSPQSLARCFPSGYPAALIHTQPFNLEEAIDMAVLCTVLGRILFAAMDVVDKHMVLLAWLLERPWCCSC